MTPESDIITIFVSKEITQLYKNFLELIEDIETDHSTMISKLTNSANKELVENVNYLTKAKRDQIRKRVLDQGNESSRKIINFLDYFEFIINKEKVAEDAKQKRITYRKYSSSYPVIIEEKD